ncbi:acyl-CoA oxidase [Lanmaoa asiatica]|nr:acyl-CoA oxidase [Lanmaoa asiatica]
MANMSNGLSRHPLFNVRTEFLSVDDCISLSYQRAKLVIQAYSLSASDVQHCSTRYWSMMTDPVLALDTAMTTILFVHVGLAIGTLSRHLQQRPDLEPLVNSLLRFDTVGLYHMSERGHGLDAFNIETTATKTSHGFIINTPREEACKFMPASTPSFRIPKVALVMARLIVDGEDRGPRFFIVPICNEREMFKGVESIRLGPRSGTTPLDFSITRFDHVLGPSHCFGDLEFGGPFLAPVPIDGLGRAQCPVPIISFRTQQWPVLHAVAVSFMIENWYSITASQITNESVDPRVRHGLAVIVKATISRHVQRCISEVSERCGAQSLFENNFMARFENDCKSIVIAEGDVLTLCIRLFSELLLQRYQMPLLDASESLLARHARFVTRGEQSVAAAVIRGSSQRSLQLLILPQAEHTIEAMGHSMAYSAGVQRGLPKPILDIYECAVIRRDPAWYSEKGGLTRHDQRVREDRAVTSAMPHLAAYLDDLNIEAYVSAPIVSDAAWKKYYGAMPVFKGNAMPVFDQIQARL